MTLKAVGFDLFGTLLQASGDHRMCLNNVHERLSHSGIDVSIDDFLETYREIHANYRSMRITNNKEISNRFELGEILKRFGHVLDLNCPLIIEAVRAYFSPWKITITEGAEETLQHLHKRFTTSVVTNFTDACFVHECLRDLKLLDMLNYVVVSADVGWRKPNPRIFNRFLQLTQTNATEALFIGDDPHSDIAGARALGMTTVLFESTHNHNVSDGVRPDFIISSLGRLSEVVRSLEER